MNTQVQKHANSSARSSLIRQEDTIIFNFIERAQFAKNSAVYTPDAVPVPGVGSLEAVRKWHSELL